MVVGWVHFWGATLPETNIDPENRPGCQRKPDRLPTIHFLVRKAVSFRVTGKQRVIPDTRNDGCMFGIQNPLKVQNSTSKAIGSPNLPSKLIHQTKMPGNSL